MSPLLGANGIKTLCCTKSSSCKAKTTPEAEVLATSGGPDDGIGTIGYRQPCFGAESAWKYHHLHNAQFKKVIHILKGTIIKTMKSLKPFSQQLLHASSFDLSRAWLPGCLIQIGFWIRKSVNSYFIQNKAIPPLMTQKTESCYWEKDFRDFCVSMIYLHTYALILSQSNF